jgi:hypothetical protein|tara:strand:- start:10843 stop:11112 length:270 start_codon:yes stop_codon:yes gene_type:complete
MAFDPQRASLTQDQLELARVLDQVWEVSEPLTGDRFSFGDLFKIPGLLSPLVSLVKLLRSLEGRDQFILLLLGAAAAFANEQSKDNDDA